MDFFSSLHVDPVDADTISWECKTGLQLFSIFFDCNTFSVWRSLLLASNSELLTPVDQDIICNILGIVYRHQRPSVMMASRWIRLFATSPQPALSGQDRLAQPGFQLRSCIACSMTWSGLMLVHLWRLFAKVMFKFIKKSFFKIILFLNYLIFELANFSFFLEVSWVFLKFFSIYVVWTPLLLTT